MSNIVEEAKKTFGKLNGLHFFLYALNRQGAVWGYKKTIQKTEWFITSKMVRPEGVEPATFWSVARRSIQLSYERTSLSSS